MYDRFPLLVAPVVAASASGSKPFEHRSLDLRCYEETMTALVDREWWAGVGSKDKDEDGAMVERDGKTILEATVVKFEDCAESAGTGGQYMASWVNRFAAHRVKVGDKLCATRAGSEGVYYKYEADVVSLSGQQAVLRWKAPDDVCVCVIGVLMSRSMVGHMRASFLRFEISLAGRPVCCKALCVRTRWRRAGSCRVMIHFAIRDL